MTRVRTAVGWGLVAVGLVVLGVSLAVALAAARAYPQAMASGELTGVWLTRHRVVTRLVPLAATLVLAGLLFQPPALLQRWWQRLPAQPPQAQPLRSPISQRDLTGFALWSATALGLATILFIGEAVVGAARYYGYGGVQLAALALQDLVLMAPVLSLGSLLAWAGLRARR